MRNLIISCLLLLFTSSAFAQTEAKFSLRDDSQKILCYTGLATRNTTVKFKNTSTCSSGNCLYVWNYGDGSQDSLAITKELTVDGSHEYTKDGLYVVHMLVVDQTSIADSIKNRPIQAIEYISASNDSTNLSVTYTATDKSTKQATIRIPSKEFSKKTLPYDIEVYSPFVEGPNFTYEIDDPTTSQNKGGLESFVYILNVNQENFKPHEEDVWRYYWSIYNDKSLVTKFDIDSMEYRYTFPKENFDPGYTVNLKIALDSSKFDPDDITYYNLEECVATQSLKVIVTDYFFSDSTRTKNDIDDRKTSIPNTFTPGGGDENDVFYFNTNGIDEFSIWIYNNNGTLVYKQVAKNISWTGVDNSGHDCPSGTYYYVVKSTSSDKRHNTAGFIHLFRQN